MTKTMKIEGMSCMHCAGRVESALKAVPGVADAKVNLEKKEAVITLAGRVESALKAVPGVADAKVNLEKKEAVITLSENVPASKLMGAVEDAGYEPVSLS